MANTDTDHEQIFTQICNQLNQLSHRTETEEGIMDDMNSNNHPQAQKYEVMQSQMKRFNNELIESQEEIKNKIKNLGNVHFGVEALDQQVRQLAEQLANERATNTKLSGDLAKSLELSLQLQLEIQGLKAKNLQIQTEEKKYSSALLEKTKILQRDLDLSNALKDETAMELAKAKNAFQKEVSSWEMIRQDFESKIRLLQNEKSLLENKIDELKQTLNDQAQDHATEVATLKIEHQAAIDNKESEIQLLNQEIEEIQSSFKEVESSAHQQQGVLDNLMAVAEGKIVEMKLALDKKSIEAQDYYSHLQQALTQLSLARQENNSLKDYVQKLNYYHQQAQHVMGQAVANNNPQGK